MCFTCGRWKLKKIATGSKVQMTIKDSSKARIYRISKRNVGFLESMGIQRERNGNL